jgi:hypothetical protein
VDVLSLANFCLLDHKKILTCYKLRKVPAYVDHQKSGGCVATKVEEAWDKTLITSIQYETI